MPALPRGTVPKLLPFIREYAPGHYASEIADEVNRRFCIGITEKQVRNILMNHNINNGMRGRVREHWNKVMTDNILQWLKDHQWTHNNAQATEELRRLFKDERITHQLVTNWRRVYNLEWRQWNPMMIEFLTANYDKMTSQEMTDYLNKTFDKHLTRPAVTAYMSGKGLLKGQPYMRRNPSRTRPIGYERLRHGHRDKRCYWEVKTEQGWRPKSHVMYEKYHGTPVPKGYIVVYLDNDYNNFAEENLQLVSLKAIGIANSRYKCVKGEAEINKLMYGIAELDYAVAKTTRENKESENR